MHDDDELITIEAGCAIVGGPEKPISPSTFYRGVAAGRYSPPVHPSPGISRLRKRKLQDDLARLTGDQGADA